MPRLFLILLVLTTEPVRSIVGQTCRLAKPINDTSHVTAFLRTSFNADSIASHHAWQTLRSLDSTAIPGLLAAMCGGGEPKALEGFGLPLRAGGVLSRLGPAGIRALVAALRDSDSTLALNAALALEVPGEDVPDATPELLPLLSDARPKVRERAAELVRLDGSARRRAIATLARTLADPDSGVRLATAGRLFTLGRQSEPLVPDLVRAMHDPVAQVRREAALAIGRTHTTDTAAAAMLSQALHEDREVEVREAAARAIGWLGRGGEPGVRALTSALRERNASVRAEAAQALGHIAPDSLGPTRDTILGALSAALADRDSLVRSSAADALREIGLPAAAHQVQSLRNRDPKVRITATRALGEQPPTPEAIDALTALLRDPSFQVREEAISALGGFGPAVEGRMRTLLAGSDQVAKLGATQVLQYLRDVGRLPIADACFDLSLAGWKPSLGLGEDTIFSTPPTTVRFSRVKSFGFGSYNGRLSFRVLPANGASMSVHGPGYWTPIRGTDSVSIVWTTGFSGLTMKLAVARDTLHGVAQTFWDFPRPPQTSQVTGRRVVCR